MYMLLDASMPCEKWYIYTHVYVIKYQSYINAYCKSMEGTYSTKYTLQVNPPNQCTLTGVN